MKNALLICALILVLGDSDFGRFVYKVENPPHPKVDTMTLQFLAGVRK